ncbi:hypothetical protein DFH07DRAFT_774805 [Mycena maculata]|uniref:FAD/NAD(P)-binding domain-containing protein n=1 Tax=Mycena maculata TaxID=230809 RepID=A0AAD7NAH7_9AGAR|nr:hypothetical protein DFH07DRAFT_774805 [Mycena maculata]
MEDQGFIPNARPKRILVIGGGASGLVTLRNLRDRGEFDEVQLVERRDDVGGVWYLDGDPNAPNTGAPRWPSPAYPGLIGNVLPEFLSFSAFPPFPETPSTATGQPFPSLSEAHAYLRAFAAPLVSQGAIRLNTEVQAVEELPARTGWRVRLRRWCDDGTGPEEFAEIWDAVVVAVACYDHPVFPNTPGIAQLRELHLARHAQGWRGPQGYKGKRVLVVGNANSGNDMAAQLAPVAGAVYQSIRRPNFPGFPSLPDARISRVAPVAEYIIHSAAGKNTIDAHLTDGTTLPALDAVLFGTGYRPFPDFVRVLRHNVTNDGNGIDNGVLAPLVTPTTSPVRVPFLHRYTLYAPNPSLALVGTAFASYTPFTLADVCSTWLALAWSGALAYPTSLRTLLAFEDERLAAVEAARVEMESTDRGGASALVAYGVLGPFEEAYAGALRAEVVRARPELDGVLPVWSPERTAVREAMFDLKRRALEAARARGL